MVTRSWRATTGTTDLVTSVDPARRYAVRTPTAHPIYEHERVTEWARLLTASPSVDGSTRMPRDSAR